ncbi:MAG TPA: FAD:protein FMN transferase, partial [Kofleriaceae bacterium]|nr:FAD:protein FMN transferase [Kofleriaceae bacterium]
MRRASIVALGLLALAASRTGAEPDSRPTPRPDPDRKFEYHGQAMGTVVSVYFWGDDEAAAAKGAEAVFNEMKRLDKVMTTWDPASEVSHVIAAAGETPIAVSEETYAVIDRAMDVSKRSNGIFDITVGAFKGLWKF